MIVALPGLFSYPFLFIKHVTDCVERYILVKRQNQTKVKSKWLDAYCLKCVKLKSKAWNRYLHTRDQNDYMNYCAARNKATKATLHAKKKYEYGIAQNIKENPKTFWYVKSKTKSNTGVADLKDKDGYMVSTDIEKANLLKNVCFSVHKGRYTPNASF